MKKKLAIVIAALLFVCQAGYSQSVDKMIKEFSNVKGAEVIHVGSSIMAMADPSTMGKDELAAMAMADSVVKEIGVEDIEICSLEKCESSVKTRFNDAMKNLKDKKYEPFLQSNEEDEYVKILLRTKKDKVREMVVLVGGNDCTMIRIKGEIKLDDIGKIVSVDKDDR